MALNGKSTDTKNDPSTTDIELDDVADPTDGNAQDRRDMTRMGKAQELKVGNATQSRRRCHIRQDD